MGTSIKELRDSTGLTQKEFAKVFGIPISTLRKVISINEDLDGVKSENLSLYIKDLFDEFYDIQEIFNSDCRFDKQEDIIWS